MPGGFNNDFLEKWQDECIRAIKNISAAAVGIGILVGAVESLCHSAN